MGKVHFYSKGQRVNGTLFVPEKAMELCPGVIFFHGMTSSEKNYLPIAQILAENGIAGLTVNLRGHGTSEGDFNSLTVADARADGLAAYDSFAGHALIDPYRIGICGASLGAAVGALISSQRPVKSLALRVPATYTEQMMIMTYKQIMAEEIEIFQNLNNEDILTSPAIQSITSFAGSLLIITSEHDRVIPKSISSAFYDRAETVVHKNLVEIKEAGHALIDDKWRKQFIDQTVEWFKKTL